MTRLLVDGNGVACRAWWANPRGGCVDRFRSAILRAYPKVRVDSQVVCWDAPGADWRRARWPQYKADRPPKPQALAAALLECREVFDGMEAPGFEADDLIATLARETPLEDVTLILSDDKDMLQLVRRNVLVVTSKGAVFDVVAVEKKWGVPPRLIRHLFSWMGDEADGLPGVPGFGPKKAIARALAEEIGDQLSWELAELVTVPHDGRRIWAGGGPLVLSR